MAVETTSHGPFSDHSSLRIQSAGVFKPAFIGLESSGSVREDIGSPISAGDSFHPSDGVQEFSQIEVNN